MNVSKTIQDPEITRPITSFLQMAKNVKPMIVPLSPCGISSRKTQKILTGNTYSYTTPKQGKAMVRRYVIQDADIYGIAGGGAAMPSPA